MIRALLVLVLIIASMYPAFAAPTLRQAVGCGATAPAFAGAPTNGDIVAGASFSNVTLGTATLKDSNSVSYPQESGYTGGASTAYTGLWDAVVSGSPTKTYTFSVSKTICLYDLENAAAGTFCKNNTTSSPGATLTCTIAGVVANDILIISGQDVTSAMTNEPSTNNGSVTLDGGTSCFTNGNCAAHLTATSTASTTVTLHITAGDSVAVAMADYGPAASTVPLFMPQFVGDVVFEKMLELL